MRAENLLQTGRFGVAARPLGPSSGGAWPEAPGPIPQVRDDPMSRLPRTSPVTRAGLVVFMLLAGLLSAIVLTLNRQAVHSNGQQVTTQLVGSARMAALSARTLADDLQTRAGRVASSVALQRALADGDRATLRRIAKSRDAQVEFRGEPIGVLPAPPRLTSTATIRSGSATIARVTVGLSLDATALTLLRRATPLPPKARLVLLERARVLAGATPGARAVVGSDHVALGGTSYAFASAPLPVKGVTVLAIESLADVSAPTGSFLRHSLIAALLTLLLAGALALLLARPLARMFGDLSERAERDELTGLANRRTLDDRLREEIDRARRYRTHLTLVLIDTDDFKQVNDRYGHQCGDDALRSVASVLSRSLRELDLAGRFGGEEFALVLPGTSVGGAGRIAEKIRSAIADVEVLGPGSQPIRVTASFGMAEFPACATLEELVERADRCLYEAKRRGKNRVVAPDATEAERVRLLSGLA